MKAREKERLRNEYIDTHGCEPPLSAAERLKQLICACCGKKKTVSSGPKRRKTKKNKKQKRKKKKKRGSRALRNRGKNNMDKQKITRLSKKMLMESSPGGPKVRASKFRGEAKVHPYNPD